LASPADSGKAQDAELDPAPNEANYLLFEKTVPRLAFSLDSNRSFLAAAHALEIVSR
jgi:hypothetical protein